MRQAARKAQRLTQSALVLEKLIGPVFNRISAMLVDAFIQEADRQYGDD